MASLLKHKGLCLFVCVSLFSIEIQTAGQIAMKFGKEVFLEGGRFLGEFRPIILDPVGLGCLKGARGASGALAECFGENFIKKLTFNLLVFLVKPMI